MTSGRGPAGCDAGPWRCAVWDSVVTAFELPSYTVGQLGRRSTTCCVIFGVDWRNSACAFVRDGEQPKTPAFCGIPGFPAGVGLAPRSGEYHVFRAALFWIVLTLAAGQNAILLCTVWCHDTTSAGCPRQDSTTSPDSTASAIMSADDSCGSAFVGALAFVREDARRTAAAPDAQNALVVPRFRLAPSPTELRSGFESGRRPPLEERPLVTTLRI